MRDGLSTEERGIDMAGAWIHASQTSDGSVLIEVRGEIDVESANRLRTMLIETVTRLRPRRITVDLLHVTFIDSTGIGALAAGSNAAGRLGIPCLVARPSAFVERQLHQTGVYESLSRE